MENTLNNFDLKTIKEAITSMDKHDELEECFKTMLNKKVDSATALEQWLLDLNTIQDEISEVLIKDYANFQCHNDNEEIKARFTYDQQILSPLLNNYQDQFDKFFYNNKFRAALNSEYDILIEKKVNAMELFREENVELGIQEDKLSTDYYDITGKITVMWQGEEKTLPQMAIYLKDADRTIRETAWKLIQERRLQDVAPLDDIMDKLVAIRHKKALNSGLSDYRSYKFKDLERFSYTPEDCIKFHESVLKYVVPLSVKIQKEHQQELNIDTYKPWDIDAVQKNELPLKPYNTVEELIDGVIRMFERTDKFFSDTLKRMKNQETLDLKSRKAKSPGGFCDYFPVSKIPFIFMNGAQSHDDVVTLAHEGGHSVHNMLCADMKISDYRNVPSESAELASMSMELITMDKWDEFYKNDSDLKRAKREKLEGIIKFLPWGITVDKFQHWIYLNPQATSKERNDKFAEIAKEYTYSSVDFTGFEDVLKHRWKNQLHIYEVPFYYIEYAIAQLGALQVWKNYKENPKKAIEAYKNALSLGCSKPLPEVYAAAGIRFDFSEEIIKDLMDFVSKELETLK
ncbi:MAG: M3 family oligoendopeptidase [Clostridium sp.]|uniref:M3 family oligoendopeptidase n=1 Tax=Clostridium sp. TaxID=1506 RepID=UPI003D6D3241